MHQELRGIRAIDADCNRRLHLKGWRVLGQLRPRRTRGDFSPGNEDGGLRSANPPYGLPGHASSDKS
jgi:hypothetical protein